MAEPQITQEQLESALAQAHGNRLQAAKQLGISRATLYRVIRRFTLEKTPRLIADRYQVQREIGSGSQSEVFEVTDTRSNGVEARALKLFRTDAASTSELERWRREARALIALKHPQLVAIHDLGIDSGTSRPFLVMDLVRGVPFATAAAGKSAPWVLRALASALLAVERLHRHGTVHRDLKSENVLIVDDERHGPRAVVMDLGLSEQLGTASEGAGGTLLYAAPELFAGAPASTRSDLYALGVMLYLALTGRYPYQGRTAAETVELATASHFVPASESRADLPASIDMLIASLLASDPAVRCSDARSVLEAIHATLGQVQQAPAASTLSLAGRSDQIGTVVERLLCGESRGIVVVAEDGLGKSRFLEACALELKARGERVVAIEQLDRAFPDASVVVVDDVDRQSPADLAAWESSLSQLGASGPLWLLAARPFDRWTESAAPVLALVAEQSLIAWELPPLDLAAVRALATDVLGPTRAAVIAERLHRSSAGRPLWVQLGLQQMQRHGDRFEASLPQSLEELAGSMLEPLDSGSRRLVETLAVIDAAVPQQLLEQVIARPLEPALTHCIQRGLVHRAGANELSIAHPQLCTAIESLLDAALLRETRLRWVDALAHDESRALLRAKQWLAIGVTEAALPTLRDAIAELEARHLYRAAARMTRTAVDLVAADSPERLELLGRLERQCLLGRDIARGMEAARLTIEAAERGGDLEKQARAWSQLASRHRDRAEWGEALTAASNSVRLADESGAPKVRASARNTAATIAWNSWDPHRALEIFDQTVAIAREAGDQRMVAFALHNTGVIRVLCGYCAAGLEAIDTSEQMLVDLQEPFWRFNTKNMRGNAMIALGHEAAAIREFDAAIEGITALSSELVIDHALESLGLALLRHGSFDRAADVGERLINVAIAASRPASRVSGLLIAGRAAAELDDLGTAREHHRLALSLAEAFEETRQRDFARISIARDLRQSARLDEAREIARQAFDSALRTGNRRPLGLAGLELAEIALMQSQIPEAHRWLDQVQASLSVPSEDAPTRRAALQLLRARSYLAEGRLDLVEREAVEARGSVARYGPAVLCIPLAVLERELAEAQGDRDAAEQAHARAAHALVTIGQRIADPIRRATFLARPDVAPWLQSSRPRVASSQVSSRALSRLYEIGRAVASEGKLDTLLARIVEIAIEAVGADRGLLVLRESTSGALYAAASHGVEERTANDAITISHSVLAQASRGRAVLSRHALDDPQLAQAKSVALFGIRSLMCVPLTAGSEVLGTLYVDSRTNSDGFGPEQLEFLEAIADQAAVALSYARLLGQVSLERDRLQRAIETSHRFGSLIARSSVMQDVFARLERVASSDIAVIISGESGTGKELVARALHFNSPRRERAFLTENCAAIPEPLLESLLFGHAKGAFTGADIDRRGLFELADGGTLFLDEIGDMSLGLQSKLLRVLQEGEFRPLGQERLVHVDVRVVTATHRDLAALVESNQFRQDLYFRLAGVTVTLPPLRDRLEDVPLLAQHFLEQESTSIGCELSFEPAVLKALARYPWPGNVRELSNVVRRLALFASERGRIGLKELRIDPQLGRYADEEPKSAKRVAPAIDPIEVKQALAKSGGDRNKAAAMLRVSRATFYRRLKQLGID